MASRSRKKQTATQRASTTKGADRKRKIGLSALSSVWHITGGAAAGRPAGPEEQEKDATCHHNKKGQPKEGMGWLNTLPSVLHFPVGCRSMFT